MSLMPDIGPKGLRSSMELLPWMVPIAEGLILCKDGSLLACYEFVGIDLDGSGEDTQRELAAAADRFMDTFRDRPVSMWWTVHRQKTAEYPEGRFPSVVGQVLDDDNRAQFLNGGNYRNRHFLSVLWQPPVGASGVMDRVSAFVAEGLTPIRALIEGIKASVANRSSFAFRATEIDQAVGEFEPLLERAEGSLYLCAPRRLRGKELLGFLWACANPGQRMVPKGWDGQSLLDGWLPETPISHVADSNGVIAFGDNEERRYAAAISLRSPPKEGTAFAGFSGLLMIDCELTLSVLFRVMSTNEAEKHMAAVKRINETMRFPITAYLAGAMRGGQMNDDKADPARTEAVNEVLAARGEMTSGRSVFGNTNVSLVLYNEDRGVLEAVVKDTMRSLYAGKFVGAVRETLHLLSSWATTLPGQWGECQRWIVLSSQNAVDLAPLVGVHDGEFYNEHLTRQMGAPMPCLTALSTEYRTPFYLNLHSGGVGHALVLGPTGSGKSVGMNFLLSQWGRYPNSRVLIFDKDYSCRIPTLLQGGKHIDLKPGARIRLNPLKLALQPEHRPFVVSWIEGLISARGYKITTQDSQKIAQAVADLASPSRGDLSLIRLSGLATQLDSHLRDELTPWLRKEVDDESGSLSAYFDHEEDEIDLAGHMTAIEMNDVMRIPMVARAFLDYAFYRLRMLLEGAADGSVFPTVIYIEECWFLMQDDSFLDRLIDWLKTFRKLNCSVVMATQSLEDIASMSPRVLAALRDNVMTRIYLPNPSAMSESAYPMYRKGMGLTDGQISRIANATPREDYFVVKPGVARLVKMRLTPRQVSACRSDQLAQRTFERIYRPDAPVEQWAPEYLNAMLEKS